MKRREDFLKAKIPEISRETREKILAEELEEEKKELEDQRAKERARDRRAKACPAVCRGRKR